MDLIIELIVWIFKQFMGENTYKPPGTSQSGPSSSMPTQRGPYNYGDGRPVAGKQRTLEEILEEVKRQQSQGKSGGQRPKVQRAAMPAAPEKAKVQSLSRPLSEVQQPTEARSAAPAPLPSKGGAIQSKIETRVLAPTLDQKELVKPGLEKKFEKITERESQQALSIGRTKLVAEVNTVSTMGEVQSVDTMSSSLSEKKVNVFADYFRAMRTAPPKSRAEMARRAFVYAEVFGPPRSRQNRRR